MEGSGDLVYLLKTMLESYFWDVVYGIGAYDLFSWNLAMGDSREMGW